MKINKIATPPRGTLYQTTSNNAFIPSGGKYENRLVEIADYLLAGVEKTNAKFTPEHQQPENKQIVDMLFSRMRLTQRDINDAQRDLNKRNATFAAPAALTDAAWESEFASTFARCRSLTKPPPCPIFLLIDPALCFGTVI